MFAGPGRRVAAALTDAFVVGALLAVATVIANLPLMDFMPKLPGEVAIFAPFFLPVAVPFLYFVVFPATRMQGTPGKSALGIRIATVGGDRIGFVRSLVRFAASLVSIATFFLGYLPMVWTRKRRALHDFVAGTVVVHQKARASEIAWAEPPAPTWLARIGGTAAYVLIAVLPVVFYRGPLNGELAEQVNEHNMRQAVPVVAALDAYRAKNGRYPERLEGLTPAYLQAMPRLAGKSALRFAATPAGDGCWLAIVYWMEAGLLPHDRINEYDCRTREWRNLDYNEMHAAGTPQ